MLAGSAFRVVTNELGRDIQGATTHQVAKSVRDPLEANVLYLANGDNRILLASVDVAGLETSVVAAARDAMAKAAGIHPRDIVIAGTHTHAGPSVLPTCYGKPVDTAWHERLQAWLVEAAVEAVEAARPVQVAWGAGNARIGYNRRCCWADGSHSMHGDPSRPDFTGMEGPDDTSQLALFFRDETGQMVAVFHHNTTHATSFYGADFYSADFPGTARAYLRQVVGDVPVLYFNGAFGDISIGNQASTGAKGGEEAMLRAAHILAGETLRLLHDSPFHDDAPLAHLWEDLPVAVRLPSPERLAEARALLARVDAGEDIKAWDILNAHGTALLADRFGDNPVDPLAIHALRIGDVAIATQPCELYCQFGLDIKRRSPAPITAVTGIADGYGGYCPTVYGIIGGGYSGDPIYWTRLVPEGGYQIVDAAARLLHRLWL